MKSKEIFSVLMLSIFALLATIMQSNLNMHPEGRAMSAQALHSILVDTVPDQDTSYINNTQDKTNTGAIFNIAGDTKIIEGTAYKEPEANMIAFDNECPFIEGVGNKVVVFRDQLEQVVDIEPGTYAVELASFHAPDTYPVDQNLYEMWHLELEDGQKSPVYQSPQIRDMREDELKVIELVDGRAVISDHAQHAYARIDSRVEMRSGFRPLCASLRFLDATPTLEGIDNGVVQTNMTVLLSRDEVRHELLAELDVSDIFTSLLVADRVGRRDIVERFLAKNFVSENDRPRIDLDRAPAKEARKEGVRDVAFEVFRYKNRAALASHADADADGIYDYDERYVYGTDPDSPYTSGGIFTDGERLLLGFDPRKDDLVTTLIESPKFFGETTPDLFSIENIFLENPKEATQNSRTVFVGNAAPFSFVTLFMYPTPITATIRTDEKGRFEYVLDEVLDDGSYELYIASISSSGEVLAKSDLIPFIKTAQAIEYIPTTASVSYMKGSVDNAVHTHITLFLFLALLISVGTSVTFGMMGQDVPRIRK